MNYEVSDEILAALDRYVDAGIMPGDFLTAMLENDLKKTYQRVDGNNLKAIPEILSYIYNELPAACWGSPEKVTQWKQQLQIRKGA